MARTNRRAGDFGEIANADQPREGDWRLPG
jgi:hypothetical protein